MSGVNVGRTIVLGGTDKALRVQIESEDEPRWIPKSQIDDDSEVFHEKSDPGDLIVTAWFAEKEDLK